MSEQTSQASHARKTWGPWATLGLGLGAMFLAQIPAMGALALVFGTDVTHWPDLAHDPVATVVLICVSTPVQVALVALLAQRASGNAGKYLGFAMPSKNGVVLGVSLLLAFVALFELVDRLIGHRSVTPYQSAAYEAARRSGMVFWLFLTYILAAPLGEETLFRGFLFRGWTRSSGNPWLPIGATALLWAALHVQYDIIDIGQIFVAGLILGWMRWSTGSIAPTLLMHSILNAFGTLETWLSIRA